MTLMNLNHVTLWQANVYYSLEYFVFFFFFGGGGGGGGEVVVIYSQVQSYRQQNPVLSEHHLM